MSVSESSPLVDYGLPILGVLLVATGTGGAVYGGYVVLQGQLGLCGTPTIGVWPADSAKSQGGLEDRPLDLETLPYEDLSPAEQRAFEDAVRSPNDDGGVSGAFPHEPAFRRGVLVTYRGETRYATLESPDTCAAADPLLLPISLLLVGAGALTYAGQYVLGRGP